MEHLTGNTALQAFRRKLAHGALVPVYIPGESTPYQVWQRDHGAWFMAHACNDARLSMETYERMQRDKLNKRYGWPRRVS